MVAVSYPSFQFYSTATPTKSSDYSPPLNAPPTNVGEDLQDLHSETDRPQASEENLVSELSHTGPGTPESTECAEGETQEPMTSPRNEVLARDFRYPPLLIDPTHSSRTSVFNCP